jgi:hypothetical protein
MVITMTVGFTKVPPEDDQPVDLEAVEEVEDVSAIEVSLQEGLAVTSVPDDLEPSLTSADGDRPVIYDDGCHLDSEVVSPPGDCAYGDVDGAKTVVLMGDSHAAQWFPALEPIAEEQGWRLLTRTKSSCTPVSVIAFNDNLGREYTECGEWRENVFAELDDLQPDLVILSGEDSPSLVEWEEDTPERWADGWTDTLERVTAAAGQTAVLTDTPRSPTGTSIPECLALNHDNVQECVMDRSEAIDDTGNREAAMAAQQEAGAAVIETVGWFCYSGACPVITGDLLVYRDSHHMSTPYARSLSTLLGDQLPPL